MENNTQTERKPLTKKQIGLIVTAALVLVAVIITVLFLINYFISNDPGPRVVYSYGDYDYVYRDDGTIELVAYYGSEVELTLPAVIDGVDVTRLGDYIFDGGNAYTKITVGAFVREIGDYAFRSCTTLSEVTLPTTLKTIGDYSFRNCSSLEKLELPEGLLSIGEGCFFASALTEIKLPYGITEIPDAAFATCTDLKTLLMYSPTSIGKSAFYNCASLEGLTFPSVREVGELAFSGCSSLKNISFGKELASLGGGALSNCSSLESVSVAPECALFTTLGGALVDVAKKTVVLFPPKSTITSYNCPDYIEYIAEYAFALNESIQTVVLSDNLIEIGNHAFNNSTALSRLVSPDSQPSVILDIPKSVKKIGGLAFEKCAFLTKLTDEMTVVGDGILIKYTPKKVSGELVNTNVATVVRKDGKAVGVSLTIPSGVKQLSTAFSGVTDIVAITGGPDLVSLSDYAIYQQAYIEKIDLTGSPLTSVGFEAFRECLTLTELKLPDSVTEMSGYTLFGCEALTSFTFPKGLTYVPEYCFADCVALTSVTLPEGLKRIKQYAFTKTYKLEGVTLPASLEYIDDYAFADGGIVAFTVPEGVTLGTGILLDNVALRELTVNGEGTLAKAIAMGCGSLRKVTLIGGFTAIGDECFYDCVKLSDITIPRSVTSVGIEAFTYCISLKNIDFSGNLTYIGDHAFMGCRSLEFFEFDSTLMTLGAYAFSNCDKLTGIDLRFVVNMGRNAFENCVSLTSADLRSVGYIIPVSAFAGCTELTNLRLADTVNHIGAGAFALTGIQSIAFPSELEYIGYSAFTGSALSEVVFGNKLKTIDYLAFSQTPLVEVVFPLSLEKIGASAFYACSNLRSIRMGDGVTLIEDGAFAYCSRLTGVELSSSLTAIAPDTFTYTSVGEIVIPEGVKTVGASAFSGCTNLTNVMLPLSVRRIEDYAFSGCEALTFVRYDGGDEGFATISFGTDNSYFIYAYYNTDQNP